MPKRKTNLTVIDGKAPAEPVEQRLENAPKCCARKRTCDCGHKFVKDDSRKRDTALRSRREPGYNMRLLGNCPECGRTRPLCTQPAMKDRTTCRMHGGKGGRKPLKPVIAACSDEDIDAIVALVEAGDEGLADEFFQLKYFIQKGLAEYANAPDKLSFAERATGLLDRAVGIQEKRARIAMMVPPDTDFGKLDFEDPRVKLLFKNRLRQSYEDAVKGTLQVIMDAMGQGGSPELMAEFLKQLPERFQNYLAVKQAKPTEAVVEDVEEPQ